MKKINITNIIIALMLLVTGLFLFRGCEDKNNQIKEAQNLIEAMHDTLQVYKGKDELNRAKILSLEGNAQDIVGVDSDNPEIKRLQALIKDNFAGIKAAIAMGSETGVNTHTKTEIVRYEIINDTVYPTYSSKIDEKGWITGTVVANKDTVFTSLIVKNDYDVVIKREKGKTIAEITNKNPFTETKTLRTFNVKTPPQKRLGVGVSIGYGITGDGKTTPYAGLGVNYNLFNF